MFKMRLSDVLTFTSRLFRESVRRTDRSTAAQQKFCQAIENHIDGLVAFAMQFSVKTHLNPQEAETVLKSLRLEAALVAGGEDEYYWKRFGDIPGDRGAFARLQIEYMMAGNAFLTLCGGKTGMQELDDMIRQFGADTFVKVCEITKKEIKSVRLYP
jgi:hypothetical protein